MNKAQAGAGTKEPSGDEGRRVGWLELFLDLVFVALAAQLSHQLHGTPDLADFGVFLALYFPPWWMWVNLMAAANLALEDSARRRFLMLCAMLCLGVMAAAVPDAAGDRGWAYAVGYAGTRLVLLGLWWPSTRLPEPRRTPRWRLLSYCLVFATLWGASAIVPTPWRYGVWAFLIVAEMVLLLGARDRGITGQVDAGHLVERVGLFIIIVLGESVIALVSSVDHSWNMQSGAVALLGFVLLAALWWSYFDFGSTAAELVLSEATGGKRYLLARDVGGYLHFFVTAAILIMSAGLATAVEEAGHAHLPSGAILALVGGLALYQAALAAIALRFGRRLRSVAVWAVPGIAIPVVVGIAGRVLAPWVLLVLIAAEVVGRLVIVRHFGQRDGSSSPIG
ncbi:low temperature requirement protein A [Streptomyces sp. NPDC059985]|uniref:low temperature requirement protein A n=1 Tax=Streptomyces sp. NPDC059985 TaxID=3347025 RepID=UPI00369D251C